MKNIKTGFKDGMGKVKNGVKNGFTQLKGKFQKKKKIEDGTKEEVKEEAPEIDVSKVTYRKTRKGLPKFFVSSSRPRLRNGLLIGIPLMLVAIGGTLGYLEASKNRTPRSEVVLNQGSDYHRIYMLSKDNYVVPISVNRTPKSTVAEEILDVFESLKVGNKTTNIHLRGYIPDDTKLNGIELTNNVLTLDFSEEFYNYTEDNELQMLQSLVFTYLEFDGVEHFQFKVDGKYVTKFPKHLTPVKQYLDRSVGINIENVSATDALSKEKTVVYYTRTYDSDNTFYIPVSVYATKGQTIAKTFYNALDHRPGILTNLKKVPLYNHIDRKVEPMLTDDAVIIDLKDTALLDEGTIQKDIFELLVMNFYLSNVTQKVSLQVNGESYRVNGYLDTDSVPVSSIISTSVAV